MRKAREGLSRRMLRVGFIRHWYARRLVKFIDKSKQKHRRLPEHMQRIDGLLRRVPQHQRVKTLEEMMMMQPPGGPEELGREFRRAAARQDRGSGRAGGNKRPGMPPQQVVRRQVKR